MLLSSCNIFRMRSGWKNACRSAAMPPWAEVKCAGFQENRIWWRSIADMQTRQQKDAVLALKHVKEVQKKVENGEHEELRKSYITATHRFPFLVRQNGLQQTLDFYAGKANTKENSDNAEAIFYRHICEVLEPEKGKDPAEKLLEASLEEYMRSSRRCLEAALWYRRFAASLLDDEKIKKMQEGDHHAD
ncbi:MAG: type III-B CRISPR module-associated protein Cmr5 [Candidatus Electrothrix sp. AR3]|nr:type III-B CRISPR module-associated protein Cmr5 [Candidatus Electrothrix sp. AR3]